MLRASFVRIAVISMLLANSLELLAAPGDFRSFIIGMARDGRPVNIDPFLPGRTGPDLEIVLSIARHSVSQDDFTNKLKAKFPGLFINHVLMHRSSSLQPASKEKPRVLLFGWGLMLAFDGERNGRVEIIAFNKTKFDSLQSDLFDFAEIEFTPTEKSHEESPAGSAPFLAEIRRNPPVCQSCHGNPGKPLWEPYDFWPDAYGSAIGRFRTHVELTAYKNFMEIGRTNGVYRHLSDEKIKEHGEEKLPSVEAFTQYVQSLNFLRIANLFQKHVKTITPFAPALMMILHREFDSDDGRKLLANFPSEMISSARKPYLDFLAESIDTRRIWKSGLDKRYAENFGEKSLNTGETTYEINHDRLNQEAVVLAQLRFILENIGLNAAGFSTSFALNPWFMSTPNNFAAADLMAALQLVSPEFEKYTRINFNIQDIRTALSDVRFPKINPANASSGSDGPSTLDYFPPLARCATCHGSALRNTVHGGLDEAPHIPFDDFHELQRTMAINPFLRISIISRLYEKRTGRMPPWPHAPLSEDEITAFKTLLAVPVKGNSASESPVFEQ
jgi:hypothetical protein